MDTPSLSPPSLEDIRQAQKVIAAYCPRTPFGLAKALSQVAGCQIYLKNESILPVGSFKARGAIYRLALLSPKERLRGVITASTGNHGWAVAWAARQVGTLATVVLPTKVSALKRQAIADVGARIVIAGQNWNESLTMARAMAAESGAVYVEDGNDPALMAGAATVALEMLEEQPEIEIIVVPVGSGNLLAGCVLATSYPFVRGLQAAQALQREVEIIGVQSEAAPGSWLSWQRGEIVTAECKTFADGIATTRPLGLAFQVFHDRVAGMYLVSESELLHALALMVKHQTLIVEGAAAAPLAAVLRYPEYFARRRVALVVTGRNIDADTLARALESSDASHLPETLPVALTPA